MILELEFTREIKCYDKAKHFNMLLGTITTPNVTHIWFWLLVYLKICSVVAVEQA